MLHGVTHAPADIAIPDIARVLFWPGLVRVETRYHCLNQVCFYGQIKLVEQIVLGGKVAKQRTSVTPALRAMAEVEAAIPDWAKAAVAASSNACFLSSLLGRATTLYLTHNKTTI